MEGSMKNYATPLDMGIYNEKETRLVPMVDVG